MSNSFLRCAFVVCLIVGAALVSVNSSSLLFANRANVPHFFHPTLDRNTQGISRTLTQHTNDIPYTPIQNSRDRSLANVLELQTAFRSIIKRAIPSVVTVIVRDGRYRVEDDGWSDFFSWENDDEDYAEEYFTIPFVEGIGSGVIVQREGTTYYVLTNSHVIGDATNVRILLDDATDYDVVVVGSDERKDIALLSFTSEEPMQVAPIGNSDDLEVGDWVLAIGSPFNLQSTVTAGIVSALGRYGGPLSNISDFIQTDAAINQGNSGGALLNIYGEIIGINTWIASNDHGNSVGIGFAIPINNLKRAIRQLISDGNVTYGWMGISAKPLTRSDADDMNLTNNRGSFVSNVYKGSPADIAGILPGDFIIAIDNRSIKNNQQLILTASELISDRQYRFTAIRAQSEITVTLTASTIEQNVTATENNRRLWPGMEMQALTDRHRHNLGIDREQSGALVSQVTKYGAAASAGIKRDDVIVRLRNMPVASLADFYGALNMRHTGKTTITIIRKDERITTQLSR